MHRSVLLLVVLLGISTGLSAQASFWDSPNAYLGQTPPGDTPKIFAPGLLADTGIAMDRVAFSPDGTSFYYCYNTTWFSSKNAKIKFFTYANDQWKGPAVLNDQYYAPTFSVDGKTLYFLGRGGEVWQSQRNGNGWTLPRIYLKSRYGLYDFMPTQSGNLYVGSNGNRGDLKDWSSYDFSRLIITPTDTVVQSLGIPLNTPGFDGDFFIEKDESFMIVSAKETKDFECELYISFRKPDKTWTNPKSLGPLINNGIAHRWGQYVTPDHKYLFYTRGTSEKSCYLYWVRFDKLLESLRHSNFAPYVKTQINDQAIAASHPFSMQIPGSTFMDDDGDHTLTYTATLNNGDPLPAWLHFDATTRTIAGTPSAAGVYPIKVTATDTANTTAFCGFSLKVSD